MTDLRVTLLKANVDPVHPSPLALKIASSNALREGCRKAQPVLMEPMMEVDIIVPEEFMGEVVGDLKARKSSVEAITPKGRVTMIQALSPLTRMFGYSTDLRSLTQGRGTFSMQFSHYDKNDFIIPTPPFIRGTGGYGKPNMDEEILQLLRDHSSEFLSGEEISRRLKVSRTAIWKGMNRLRTQGYEIKASTRSGYRLIQSPDLLTPPKSNPS